MSLLRIKPDPQACEREGPQTRGFLIFYANDPKVHLSPSDLASMSVLEEGWYWTDHVPFVPRGPFRTSTLAYVHATREAT